MIVNLETTPAWTASGTLLLLFSYFPTSLLILFLHRSNDSEQYSPASPESSLSPRPMVGDTLLLPLLLLSPLLLLFILLLTPPSAPPTPPPHSKAVVRCHWLSRCRLLHSPSTPNPTSTSPSPTSPLPTSSTPTSPTSTPPAPTPLDGGRDPGQLLPGQNRHD